MTNPACDACGGSGERIHDTSHLGDANGWNPGSVRLRCGCNLLTEAELCEFVTTMNELVPETDWTALSAPKPCFCDGCTASAIESVCGWMYCDSLVKLDKKQVLDALILDGALPTDKEAEIIICEEVSDPEAVRLRTRFSNLMRVLEDEF